MLEQSHICSSVTERWAGSHQARAKVPREDWVRRMRLLLQRNRKSATEVAGLCSARSFSGCWGPAISLLSQKCFATSGSLGFTECPFQFSDSFSFWAVIQMRAEEANCFGLWEINFSLELYLRLVKVKMPGSLTDNGQWIIFSHEHWWWLMKGFLPVQI